MNLLYRGYMRYCKAVNGSVTFLFDFVTNGSNWSRANNALLASLIFISPYTWLVKGRKQFAAMRQREADNQRRQADAALAAIEASKPLTLDASEFMFRNGGSMIRAILAGTIADGSLDEDASEALDLQLVWSEHRDNEHKDFALRAVAELKQAWLWLRCSQAMTSGSFYHGKARGVAGDHAEKAERLVSIGGESTAAAVEQFAKRTSGEPISVEAWKSLGRANYDKARVASGFHVCLGTVRQRLFSFGGLSLNAHTPVWFNGPQSEGERSRANHFARQGDQAHARMRQEQASQAA